MRCVVLMAPIMQQRAPLMGRLHGESAEEKKDCCRARPLGPKTNPRKKKEKKKGNRIWRQEGDEPLGSFFCPNGALLATQTCGGVWLDRSHAGIYVCYFQWGNPSETRTNQRLSIKLTSPLEVSEAFSGFDLKSIT